MSNLTKKFELFNGLNREDGHAIVSLIDQKTESDMDKVLNKLDLMFTTFDTRLNSMEKSFDSRLNSMEKSFDSRLDSIEKRISVLYWFIGAVITIATMAVRYLTH